MYPKNGKQPQKPKTPFSKRENYNNKYNKTIQTLVGW